MVNQLPQGWKEDVLGNKEKFEYISGVSYKPSDASENLQENRTLLLRSNNIDNGRLNLNKVVYVSNKKIQNKQYLKKNDILIATSSGSKNLVGKSVLILDDSPKTFGAFCGVIRCKNFCAKYVSYYFQSEFYKKYIYNISKGVNIHNLKSSDLMKLSIPYPTDRDEQDYIVKTLDAVAEMIKLRKETIQLTKDLIPAIFQEMFGDPITNPKGWKITTLGNPDICTLQYGYTATAQENGNIRYIRITDIGKDGYIDDSNIVWLNYENKMDDYKLRPKDILVARTGASYGKTLLYRNDADAIFASFLIRIIFNKKKIIPEFYWAYSLTASYWQQANRLVSGVAQPQFNGSALKQILLMLPPLSLQDEFAKKVERINKYIAVQQEELKHFETLFQSLLQEAFTGVLTWKYPRKESND